MLKSYSHRYHQSKRIKNSHSPDVYLNANPKFIKLKPIIPIHRSYSPDFIGRYPKKHITPILPKSRITKQIEDNAVEYESAIRKHLDDNMFLATRSSGFNGLVKVNSYKTKENYKIDNS